MNLVSLLRLLPLILSPSLLYPVESRGGEKDPLLHPLSGLAHHTYVRTGKRLLEEQSQK
ncbi:hypothetical protein CRG98_044151, partial [Punica granatum]